MQADNLRALMEELNNNNNEAASADIHLVLSDHIVSIIERASYVLERQFANESRSRRNRDA
jgi:hypothetical protein